MYVNHRAFRLRTRTEHTPHSTASKGLCNILRKTLITTLQRRTGELTEMILRNDLNYKSRIIVILHYIIFLYIHNIASK